jgi:hypothetical protein
MYQAVSEAPRKSGSMASDVGQHGIDINPGRRHSRLKACQSLFVKASAMLLCTMLQRSVNGRRDIFQCYGNHGDTISPPLWLSTASPLRANVSHERTATRGAAGAYAAGVPRVSGTLDGMVRHPHSPNIQLVINVT